MTIGQRLRAAREANEMSIGEIARRSYIQPKFIQAIEEDDLSVIPESHRRLFVREFAKHVGVPSDEILALLPEFQPPPPPTPVQPVDSDAKRSLWKNISETTARPQPSPLSEGERTTYREFLQRLSKGGGIRLGSGNLQKWLLGSAGVLLVVAIVYYAFFVKHGPAANPARTGHDSTASPTQVLSRSNSEGDTSIATSDAPNPAAGDSLSLEGRVTSKVWYAIVMDGKRSDTGMLDSGTVKVWRAVKDFKLSLANAGGLQLSLNDRKLGALGPAHTSIRNQIIDANGVKKSVVVHRPATAAAGTATTPTTRPTTSGGSTTPKPRRTPRNTTPRPPRVITPTEIRRSPP